MKPEDKVVEEVIAYFSEPKFSEFSIVTKCEIQMGIDNREADIVLLDADGNFVAIAECKSPGGANYGIPQLKSYLSATDTPFGVFAPRIERDSWIFYKNLRHNRFRQIDDRSDFEKGVLEGNTKAANIKYSNLPIGSPNPGCFVILVDQSFSMSGNWQTGTKAEVASSIVNSLIYNLCLACDTGNEIKDRCRLCVIGYGEQVHTVVDGMISDVYASPLGLEKVKKSISDGAGGSFEIEIEQPSWLQAQASNGTPMHTAFERAAEIVQHWCKEWPENFPPVVFNITDGLAMDPFLTAELARKVMDFRTTDGNVLVYNVHIANDGPEVVLAHDRSAFSQDRSAEFLFSISSPLPENLFPTAASQGFSPQPQARCFAHNVRETALPVILEFGTLGSSADRK